MDLPVFGRPSSCVQTHKNSFFLTERRGEEEEKRSQDQRGQAEENSKERKSVSVLPICFRVSPMISHQECRCAKPGSSARERTRL